MNYEIAVSARGLPSKDMLSSSDAFCALFVKPAGGGKWVETGRTETINDNNSPFWSKRFVLTPDPQYDQELKFEVYDYDPASGNDFMGRVETTLNTILGAKSRGLEQSLVGTSMLGTSKMGGKLAIIAEPGPPMGIEKHMVTLQFCAEKVESKDFIGKSDPYLVLSKCQPDGSFIVCYRTEYKKNTKSPEWKPFTLDSWHLCGGDRNRVIKIECYDYDDDSSHDFIGACTTTLNGLAEGPKLYELINESKRAKKHYSNSGFLKLVSCNIVPLPYNPQMESAHRPAQAPLQQYGAQGYMAQQPLPQSGVGYPGQYPQTGQYQQSAPGFGYPPTSGNYGGNYSQYGSGYPPNTGYQGMPPNPGYPVNPNNYPSFPTGNPPLGPNIPPSGGAGYPRTGYPPY